MGHRHLIPVASLLPTPFRAYGPPSPEWGTNNPANNTLPSGVTT